MSFKWVGIFIFTQFFFFIAVRLFNFLPFSLPPLPVDVLENSMALFPSVSILKFFFVCQVKSFQLKFFNNSLLVKLQQVHDDKFDLYIRNLVKIFNEILLFFFFRGIFTLRINETKDHVLFLNRIW